MHDWEQRKLEDLSQEAYGGGTPKTSIKEFWDGDIPWIQSSDLIEHQVSNISVKKYITIDAIQKSAAKIIPENSIAIITRVGVGKLTLIPHEYATSQDFLSLSNLNVDEWFGVYLIYKKLQSELYLVQGTSIKGLTKSELFSKQVMAPIKKQEQEKIGSFFKQLDNTIALHQRKLDYLKSIKKGYLQQLFPQNGKNVPEVRFANFDGDWEQRKFGEVVQITMGQSPHSKNYTDNPSDYILVQGNADMKNGRVTPRVWTTQVTKQADIGDLILSVRAPVGDIGKTDYYVVLGRGVASIKGNEFIFQELIKMKKNGFWNKISTGSTFESINSSDIKNALFLLPSEDEQDRIGSFLNKLDNTITLHRKKLYKLKIIKQSFLQKIFI